MLKRSEAFDIPSETPKKKMPTRLKKNFFISLCFDFFFILFFLIFFFLLNSLSRSSGPNANSSTAR